LENTPFDLDPDFLASIYPKDNLCPVLDTPLVWGSKGGRDCSPSLDRIVPSKSTFPGFASLRVLVRVDCLSFANLFASAYAAGR
jgi:hypothetical protein